MDLNTLCFLLFSVIFIGFLVLEGIDYGVSMLLFYVAKTDIERQALVRTIAPVWEGSQVWMIVAGAILFAGFPEVYATLFSGLYFALFIILAVLLLRGMAIELHTKDASTVWRSLCYWSIFFGGLIPTLLWGIAVGNLLRGLPIDGDKQYSGGFLDLFSLYTLVSGMTFVLLFLFHGAVYLAWRLEPDLAIRVKRVGLATFKYTMLAATSLAVLTVTSTTANNIPLLFLLSLVTLTGLFVSNQALRRKQFGRSLCLSSLAIVTLAGAIFAGLYPRIMVSSLDPNWSLDIYNASSNPLTLKIMTTAMLVILPVVIAFEMWKFHLFRRRITLQEIELAPYIPRLRRMNKNLKQGITYAKCLADAMDKVMQAFRSKNGAIIKRMSKQHRTVLFGKLKFLKLSAIFRKSYR